MTSDDPASGSRTVFQSSRLARPQDASKASDLLSLMSSSAPLVSAWIRTSSVWLRSVSDVAHMEKVPLGASRSVRRSNVQALPASQRGLHS